MKKKLIILILVACLGFAGYKVVQLVTRLLVGTPKITVLVDTRFVSELQRTIKQFCDTHFVPTNGVWMNDLKQQFSLVSRVTSRREKEVIFITVEGVCLLALINKNLVIDRDGNSYSADKINSEALNALKRINVLKESDVGRIEFKKFIHDLPEFILQAYAIEWRSPYVIYLMPLQKGLFPSIIRYDKIPTPVLFALGEKLVQERKNKKDVVVDFRFADQIVISFQPVH